MSLKLYISRLHVILRINWESIIHNNVFVKNRFASTLINMNALQCICLKVPWKETKSQMEIGDYAGDGMFDYSGATGF
ncbi:SsrA-binding protein [Dirofilaria immitis]